MKKIFAYIFIITLAFCGCQNEDELNEQHPSMQLSVNQLSFVNDYTGDQLVTIVSSGSWTASSNKDWCKLSESHGEAGTTRLKVSVDANASISSRSAVISIASKGAETQSVSVVQFGEKEEIVLYAPTVNIDAKAQTLEIPIVANVENLVVDIPQELSWVKVSSQSEKSSTTKSIVTRNVKLSISKNNSFSERTAVIHFKGGKAAEALLTIHQNKQQQMVLNIVNANIDENIGQRPTAGTIKFDVFTNVDYEMKIEGNWLQELSNTNDSYVMSIAENTGAARVGRIIVTQPDTGMGDTLTISQLAIGEQFVGSRYSDSLALVAIYNAIDMKNWNPISGSTKAFDLEQPLNKWSGITLNSSGRVVSWEMTGTMKADTNFRFTIPADIRNLTAATKLDLDSWNLSKITPEIGELKNLDTLFCRGNLSGEIPSELGNLSKLAFLGISGNTQLDIHATTTKNRYCTLGGTIPASLTNLTNLVLFAVEFTKVGGNIPTDINKLTKLKFLYLDRNQLSGTVPASVGQLVNLERIILEHNRLSGSIPVELSNLSKLTYLILSNNQLSGSIPASLSNLSNLVYLGLHVNGLTGSIPSTFGQLKKLEVLYLYGNQLSGSIPAELGSMTNLAVMIAFTNKLTGSIPATFDNLANLEALVIPDNQLSGVVPPGILSKVNSDPDNFIICPQGGNSFTNYTCQ